MISQDLGFNVETHSPKFDLSKAKPPSLIPVGCDLKKTVEKVFKELGKESISNDVCSLSGKVLSMQQVAKAKDFTKTSWHKALCVFKVVLTTALIAATVFCFVTAVSFPTATAMAIVWAMITALPAAGYLGSAIWNLFAAYEAWQGRKGDDLSLLAIFLIDFAAFIPPLAVLAPIYDAKYAAGNFEKGFQKEKGEMAELLKRMADRKIDYKDLKEKIKQKLHDCVDNDRNLQVMTEYNQALEVVRRAETIWEQISISTN